MWSKIFPDEICLHSELSFCGKKFLFCNRRIDGKVSFVELIYQEERTFRCIKLSNLGIPFTKVELKLILQPDSQLLALLGQLIYPVKKIQLHKIEIDNDKEAMP